MRELEHKREIERLWQEKLFIYKEQREIEIREREAKFAEEQRVQTIIEMEKQKLHQLLRPRLLERQRSKV